MSATYTITEDDYVDATKLAAKFTRRKTALYCVVSIALIALSVLGSFTDFVSADITGGVIGGLIGGSVVIIASKYLVLPMIARRNYRTYKAIHEEITIETLDDGIQFTSQSGVWKVTWAYVLKWRHNEKLILIYPMSRIFHIVPKSAGATGLDVPMLINHLTARVGEAERNIR